MPLNFDKLIWLNIKRLFRFLTTERLLLLCFVSAIQLLIILSIFFMRIRSFFVDPPNCYLDKIWTDGKTLQEVGDNMYLRMNRAPSKNIFFLETSCVTDGVIKINARQACAIESTAIMNPDHEIFVLITSQVGFRNTTELPIIDALLSYPNVHFNYLNITRFTQNTPYEDWIKTKKLFRSKHLIAHVSDVLRYLTLWKYSGTYLDLDVVMLRSLNSVNAINYAAAESDIAVAIGIMHFEGKSGFEIIDTIVKEVPRTFNGNEWSINGPWLLTRVLYKVCGTKDILKMVTDDNCTNFRVLSPHTCYNINWYDRKKFFMKEFIDESFSSISNSLMTHVWNHDSAKIPLRKDANVPYIHIARKYCPKSHRACDIF